MDVVVQLLVSAVPSSGLVGDTAWFLSPDPDCHPGPPSGPAGPGRALGMEVHAKDLLTAPHFTPAQPVSRPPLINHPSCVKAMVGKT